MIASSLLINLGSGDINEIFRLTSSAKDKWEKIGLSLGLSPEKISQIKTTNGDNCDQCLYATLNSWLVYNTLTEKPKYKKTWRTLLRVLKSPEIDEAALAETVMAKKGNVNLNLF